MARPNLLKNRKFSVLKRLIGSTALALGSLELIWASCYENGSEYIGNSLELEAMAEWDGVDGVLTSALLKAGFIDEILDNLQHYQVHDFWHHAPDYVQKRGAREAIRIEKGETIKSLRSTAGKKGREKQLAEKAQALAQSNGQTDDKQETVAHNSGQTAGKRNPLAQSNGQTDDKQETVAHNSGQTAGKRNPLAQSNGQIARTPTSHLPTPIKKKVLSPVGESTGEKSPSPSQNTTSPASETGVCTVEAIQPEILEPEPQKPKNKSPAKPPGPSLVEILGGVDSKNWKRFWDTFNPWPKDKRPNPKVIAMAWLEACKTVDPKSIFIAAQTYRANFLPPKTKHDETRFMDRPVKWLQNEGYITELVGFADGT